LSSVEALNSGTAALLPVLVARAFEASHASQLYPLGYYSFMNTLTAYPSGPFEDVLDATRSALAEQGFGVLTEIDVQSTMKAKLDRDVEQFVILGACNPTLAFQVLSAKPAIGTLLPCNVVVRQQQDGVLVEAVDPLMMLGMVEDEAVRATATEAAERLSNALASLT
jgi:uncharacterized protein (DUF302 family)